MTNASSGCRLPKVAEYSNLGLKDATPSGLRLAFKHASALANRCSLLTVVVVTPSLVALGY